MKAKVAINGYGTIGKRVADAVAVQDDMEIIGVVKTRPSFEARMALEKGFALYAATKENIDDFKNQRSRSVGHLVTCWKKLIL